MTRKQRFPYFGSWRTLEGLEEDVGDVPEGVAPDKNLYEVESYGLPACDEDVLDLQENCQFCRKYDGAV